MRRDCTGKRNQRLAASQEKCASRSDESQLGGFITSAFSAYASHSERSEAPHMTRAHYENVFCVIEHLMGGPSLRSGGTKREMKKKNFLGAGANFFQGIFIFLGGS